MSTAPDDLLVDLLTLVERLRDPDTGCPWDIKQTFETIVPYTVEETYEVVDAIESGDLHHLAEELGDLLLQIVLYAQMGKEQGAFDFYDVIRLITEKMLRRHPHVFPDGTLQSRRELGESVCSDKVKQNWVEIKKQESLAKQSSATDKASLPRSVLEGVPLGLPALMRAAKLQRLASAVGFDWDEAAAVVDKLNEELDELTAVMAGEGVNTHAALTEELGDVLFCCVNLARHLQVEPEQALRAANAKFTRRFQFIEAQVDKDRQRLQETPLERLEDLWERAKREERFE